MVHSAIEKGIEEDTQKAAAEVQLQKYGYFFDEFATKLRRIETLLQHTSHYPRKRYVYVDFQPTEQIESIQDLINSDNKIIDKVLTVFCTLCSEITFLENEAKTKYLDTVSYYGEGLPDNASYEECQLLLSKTLPLLQDLSNYVKHCERLILEIISQLSAFYRLHFEIADASMHSVFDSLADLLLIIVLLEEILTNNALVYHWSLYRRTIQLGSHSASEIAYDIGKVRQLDKLIKTLEAQLLSGKIFENVLNLNFEKVVPVKTNTRLEEESQSYLKSLLLDVERSVQRENCVNMTKLTKMSLMFVLHTNVFGSYDKKFLKSFSDLLKKFSLVTLHYNVLIQLDTFVLRYVGSLLKATEKKLFEKDQQQHTKAYLTEVTQRMNRDVSHYTALTLSWILRLEMKLNEIYFIKANYLEDTCNLLLEGVNYCTQIRALLTTVSNLHINVNKPMYKSSTLSFCRLVELIKCTDLEYARHHETIFKLINYIVQYLEYQCLTIMSNVKKTVSSSDKRFKEIRVDAISSIVIAENCLAGPPTRVRLVIAALCLNLAGHLKNLTDADKQKLSHLLCKLTTCTTLLQKLNDVSECKFMYWNKSMLPLYLEDVTAKNMETNRIQYMLSALENGCSDRSTLLQELSLSNTVVSEITETLAQYVIHPTCRKTEENLRLHALHHLQLGKRTLQSANNELTHFCQLGSLSFEEKRLDIKFCVESYLDRTFYDLTTVALHDWQTYGEMRTLAKHKFELNVTDDELPNHTLEQGPDLLEITRNLPSFVASHVYNLNNQIFVEAFSNNKHLNVINIKHATNSIRTHGAGIMSTAVNYTYQFLCSKLQVFSQFLYDEQVKSRLLKDIAFFNEQQSTAKYPYDRAERFNRGIRKLGINSDGLTCLDQFRILMSHIGNALGYVRLIRSGGLRYFSNATAFIPNLKQIANFESLAGEENFSQYSKQAAANLSDVVNNMSHSIAEGTNYFKLLVDVFSAVSEDARNDHLKNFYAVVPALTINFVEYMINAKEGLSKKNHKTNVSFTDDGFTMGVAYFLTVLKLNSQFDAFQWFQSVNERYESQKADLNKQIANISKDDLKLNHTLNLSLKRTQIYQTEFNLLYYNLYSARVLFQGQNKAEEKQE